MTSIDIFLPRNMNDTDLLTYAVRLVQGEHCVRSPGCALVEINGRELSSTAAGLVIPAGVIQPKVYTFDDSPRGRAVAIVSGPVQIRYLMAYEFIEIHSHTEEALLSHLIPEDEDESTSNLYVHPTSTNLSDFAKVPEPDEEGRYIVLPPGSLVKPCRK